VPPNGLVIYCGTIVTEEGKEKKVNIDFEPFKPINTSLYLCDNKFHTEALTALLADDNKFGFIVMDGNGALFGTLQVKSPGSSEIQQLTHEPFLFRATPAKSCTSLQ
jgi:peptide chain release factor subunit 1